MSHPLIAACDIVQILEARYAGRDYNKFPALADELLRAQVDVIVAGGPAFRTWRPGAVSVSVVFLFSGDPVDAGLRPRPASHVAAAKPTPIPTNRPFEPL